MNLKTFVVATSAAVLLAACQAGTPGMSVGIGLGTAIGSHVGLGTSINIPVSMKRTPSSEGVNIIEEQIVSYFDAQGRAVNQAQSDGFYRRLIGKNGGDYTVQDFYANGNKRTDPYTINRQQLMTFQVYPENGTLTTYAYNGNVMQQRVFRNGKLIKANY